MNSKRKARTSLHGNASQEIITTPKSEPAKQNLLSSCRRIGLNRKKNKTLEVSPSPIESNVNKNMFVEEDLKKINDADTPSNMKPSTVTSEVKSSFTSELATKLLNINREVSLDKSKVTIRKKRGISNLKRKIESDETIFELSDNSSRTISPAFNAKKVKQTLNTDESKIESEKIITTIPVSINLTRCDLNALKIQIKTPEKNVANALLEDIQENKENLPSIENKKMEEKNSEIEVVEQSNPEPVIELEKTKEIKSNKSPVLKLSNNVPAENNSLEDNSDGSDFYPNVTRKKKKKVLTNKQRNTPKPGSSHQKDTIITKKRLSTNNTPCYSDSDDDFVTTPVRRDRNSSVKSENNSQSSVKEESAKSLRKKMKMKIPVEDELNKTGHIRINENKSYTIIHRENCVSYVKSFDNDVNFKVTESDDNQQLPARNSVELPNKSKIIERKDYIFKRRDSESENAQMFTEMPSIFSDIMNNLDELSQEFQNDPPEKIINFPLNDNEASIIQDKICYIETSKLQNDNKTSEKQLEPEANVNSEKINILNTDKETPIIQEQICVIETSRLQNETKISEKQLEKEPQTSNNTEQDENKDESSEDKDISLVLNKDASKFQDKICVIETFRLQNDTKSTEKESEIEPETSANNEQAENKSESSIDEDSDETTSESDNNTATSESDSKNSEPSKSLLIGDELKQKNIKQLAEELATLRGNIKKKQERLESLQRISVYKETHNLVQLREVTSEIRRGCQEALVDLVVDLKEQSNTEFTMTTLLEFMKIPNELVGYNEQEDKFI